MAKNIGVNPNIQQAKEMQARLENQGIDMSQIDQWISTKGLESIMADVPLVTQYFKFARDGLHELTMPRYGNEKFLSVSGETNPPSEYMAYYGSDRDTSGGTMGVDYLPGAAWQNPQYMVENGFFTPEQGEAWAYLQENPLFPDPATLGGSTGSKSMAVGTPSGPGTSKHMGVAPTKSLGGGGPPPFPGAPPPTGGTYPGEVPGGGVNYGEFGFTEADMSYFQTLEASPQAGFLGILLGKEETARGVYWSMFQQLRATQDLSSQIRAEMGKHDPTTPEGAQALQQLNFQLQEQMASEKELMEKIQLFQRKQLELSTVVKSIMDKINQTNEAVIRNFRSS